jgi:transcriptional regulator with GAF, ATPase, and Fis domain
VESQSLLGHSRVILELLDEARYVAATHSKVLLTGESGVGKEVVAHLIHRASPRAHRPLVTINCAGVPEGLLESELFGHTRGSFTDANRDKRGLLETADGATVLLDEVGEMSMRMQSMLLRFLETGEIQRIGWEGKPPMVDVRVLAATNRNLYERTQAKEFREDLYYRLNVVHLVVPPLRARRDDVRPLFDHFLRVSADHNRLAMCQISPEVYELIEKYHWPGNVRELRNLAERMAVRHAGQTLGVQHLPQHFVNHGAAASANPKLFPAEPSLVDVLYDRMTHDGESFWTVVYVPFMSRDLTRDTVRAIVRRGLECVKGNYRLIPPLFNFPLSDYKRFLTFLQKHECHIPFQGFRVVAPPSQRSRGQETPDARAAG